MAGHGRHAPVRYPEKQEKFGGNPWNKEVLAVPAWGSAGKISRAGVIAALAAMTCIATDEFLVGNLAYLSCLFGRPSCHINIKTRSTASTAKNACASMRTSINLPVAGACGPPVLPTALRAYGRNFDPPEGLRPSHRAYSAAAPSPIKQLSSHRGRHSFRQARAKVSSGGKKES